MKTFNNISDFSSSLKTIVTIGTFDGVHIGHQKILEKLVENAKSLDCESLVLTFFPHPRMILQDKSVVKLLNTVAEKSILIEKTGIDNLIIHPFDKDFAQLTANEFVKNILVDTLNIRKIIIGYDHRFGKNRSANIDDLVVYGKQYDFEVEQISAQEINDIAISSTKIRNAILDGNISLANELLGYNYFFSGTVVKGKQLGRTIGFPTANIQVLEEYKLIPKNGVYIVKSHFQDKTIFGIMNIGNRPTVNGENRTIEVHYINFEADIYDELVTIEVLEFIRNEQKFDSLDLLKSQIQKDKETALSFITNSNT